MLVGIERAEAFAKQLAEAVTGIRLRHGLDADLGRALMEAHDVIGGGENHPLDALFAGGLEQVVAADDVGVEDGLPRPFDREATQMPDATNRKGGVEGKRVSYRVDPGGRRKI